MKQKFENLGVILSRNAQKKLGGGVQDEEGDSNCSSSCLAWDHETNGMKSHKCYYVIGTPIIPGFCDCPFGSGTCS